MAVALTTREDPESGAVGLAVRAGEGPALPEPLEPAKQQDQACREPREQGPPAPAERDEAGSQGQEQGPGEQGARRSRVMVGIYSRVPQADSTASRMATVRSR